MSSVLIGIIGIALFIGLAISGAIFLGPQFDAAQAHALAANSLQAVSSVASAANSYRFAKGYAMGAALDTPQRLVSAGFLKMVPGNPVMPTSGLYPHFVDGAGVDAANTGNVALWSPRYVFMSIGSDRDLCTMIGRQMQTFASGQQVSTTSVNIADFNAKAAGCFRTSQGTSLAAAGDYVVFARI